MPGSARFLGPVPLASGQVNHHPLAMDPLAISVLVRWLLGWFLCLRLPRLPQHSLAPDLASELSLSVLIPARNEARTLPRLLAALKRQSLQPLEVPWSMTTPGTAPPRSPRRLAHRP